MFVAMNYEKNLSLKEKTLYVLSLLKKASIDEVATEIIELDGISTEDGVREITIEIEEQLNKLHEVREVIMVTEHDKKKKYSLKKH